MNFVDHDLKSVEQCGGGESPQGRTAYTTRRSGSVAIVETAFIAVLLLCALGILAGILIEASGGAI